MPAIGSPPVPLTTPKPTDADTFRRDVGRRRNPVIALVNLVSDLLESSRAVQDKSANDTQSVMEFSAARPDRTDSQIAVRRCTPARGLDHAFRRGKGQRVNGAQLLAEVASDQNRADFALRRRDADIVDLRRRDNLPAPGSHEGEFVSRLMAGILRGEANPVLDDTGERRVRGAGPM